MGLNELLLDLKITPSYFSCEVTFLKHIATTVWYG